MTVGIFYGIQAVHSIPENVAIAIGSAVGYLGVGIFYGIQAVHSIPENVAIAIGSAVGYLGTEKIKEIILAHFQQKGVNNENQ